MLVIYYRVLLMRVSLYLASGIMVLISLSCAIYAATQVDTIANARLMLIITLGASPVMFFGIIFSIRQTRDVKYEPYYAYSQVQLIIQALSAMISISVIFDSTSMFWIAIPPFPFFWTLVVHTFLAMSWLAAFLIRLYSRV